MFVVDLMDLGPKEDHHMVHGMVLIKSRMFMSFSSTLYGLSLVGTDCSSYTLLSMFW